MRVHRNKIQILSVLESIKKSRRAAYANTFENGNNKLHM